MSDQVSNVVESLAEAAGSKAKALTRASAPPYARIVAGVAGALVVAALVNRHFTQQAELANPPHGEFVTIDGVRLHYIDRGEGDPLVLIHGNGSMIQDFESSGLVDLAATSHRVIVFDRPGYGYSDRPRGAIWTHEAQADLIGKALERIGIAQATVLGHSWGAGVAIALGLRFPRVVASLVLASGYYYPSVRADVVMASGPAIPVIGDIISETISPLMARLMWPVLRAKIFAPKAPPAKFAGFPAAMTFRPGEIRASAGDAALMIPDMAAMQSAYGSITTPVVIIAGEDDVIVDFDSQSGRLHADIKHSRLHRLPGVGHMVHQSATGAVMAAIEEAHKAQNAPSSSTTPRAAA